jgi:hypothetical protein
MSLISDALKKAELQRAASAKSAPGGWNRDVTPQEGRDIKRRSSAGLFWSNLFVLTALCVAAVYFLRLQPRDPTDDHTAATQNVVPATTNGAQPEVAAAQPAASASAQPPESLTASPFLSPATDTTTSPRVTEEYALDGVSALGSKTLLSIVRSSDRRSVWIPVGKSVGEITAVSYDPDSDQAVISVRGDLMSVQMRQGPREVADAPAAAE